MVDHWRVVDDYSHGFLIVPLALWFAYERKNILASVKMEGSWWGLVPLAIGAVSLAVGRLGVELTTMRWGFVFTLNGLVLLLLGVRAYRTLAFPLLFLFLMVPLPQSVVNTIAFPLQLIASKFAVSSLHAFGIPALLEGNIIHLAKSELFVAEACSGLRSLMALITLGVVFAYLSRRSMWQRALLVASAIPIAIVVNAIRVALTGFLAQYAGQEIATGPLHDFQGLITFSVALVILMGEARVFEYFWPEAHLRPASQPRKRKPAPQTPPAGGEDA